MCANPIATSAFEAATGEVGKVVGGSIVSKIDGAISRVTKMPIDKAIADRSAFSGYLQSACATISRAKTILYPQPTSIESFFEPINVVVRKGRSNTLVSTEHVEDVLKLGSRLIIAGHAGAGKSIVMRHLFIDAYRVGRFLPIYVELRTINQDQDGTSIIDLIYQALQRHGVDFCQEDFVRNLDTQDFLFLLDGLDEVSESRMTKLRDDVQSLSTKHPGIKIIMSSRLSDDEFRSWEGFVVASTVELSMTQAVSLINRLEFDDSEAKELFASGLKEYLYERHKSFASNPLLLTMMLMVFSDRAAIPDDLTEFYSQTFDTLFRRHDAGKSGKFHRNLKCGLSDDDFKRVFSNFCFITFQNDEFVFERELLMTRIRQAINRVLGKEEATNATAFFDDLLSSVCMLQLDGRRYTFVHRSFQEYFAAIYTMGLDSDETLKKVVIAWLDRHAKFTDTESSIYLNTLRKLNPDRFERQVVYKALHQLREICLQSANPQFTYLGTLYGSITLHDIHEGMHIGFSYKSPSYITLVDLLRYSLNESWNDWVSAERPGCRDIILSYLESMPDNRASLDEIRESAPKLVDALLGVTDMGARSVFAAVGRLEEKYAQTDGEEVLDNLYNL